ncbi:MAG: serine/threonine-protein kinase, partial [Pirellulales bacterium]
MIWRSQSPPATGRDADAATRSMVTPPGVSRQIAGHAVVRELKRGGLGVVYLARHLLLGELRAIKRPLDHPDLNRASILARFRREIQAVGALRHDHIIRAHDAGIDADGPYLVMEYLEGCSVSDLLARQGALPVAAACELVRQAATGLQAAHEARLIHRDLKPSNLMLARTPSGPRVVIIDWGLVKTVATPEALTGPVG